MELHASVNVRNGERDTPLHLAVRNAGSTELPHAALMAQRMIESGRAQLDLQDKASNSALILAAQRAQLPLLTLLLQKRASPNLQNNEHKTALIVAASQLHEKMVKTLLTRKETNVNLQDKEGDTALHACLRPAAAGGSSGSSSGGAVWDAACARVLLEEAAASIQLDLRNKLGEVPLLMLAKHVWWSADAADIGQRMLNAASACGTDIMDRSGGRAVLHYCLEKDAQAESGVRNKQLALAILGSPKGAPAVNLQARGIGSATALHLAVDAALVDVASKLVELRCAVAPVEAVSGDTALHKALRGSRDEHKQIALKLIGYAGRQSLDVPNAHSGKTALLLSTELKQIELVQVRVGGCHPDGTQLFAFCPQPFTHQQ